MSRLRVMTYNIWQGGRGGSALTEVVRAVAPDVLLVNEAPKTPLLWRWRCRRLARLWGMRYVVGGRSAGANMILVQASVVVESCHAQVIAQPFLRPRRGVAAARLLVGSSPVGVVACHLGLRADSRGDEVRRVLEVSDRLGGAVLVGGDLNEPPGGPSWSAFRAAGFADHGSEAWPTYPARAPEKRIDAVLVKGAVEVQHHGDAGAGASLMARASDHRPVLAEVDV